MDINTQRGMIPSLFSLILVLVLFSAVIGIAAAADPIVSIVPSQSSVCVGDDFGVYIQVNPNGNTLQMAQVDLAFDSSLVSLTVADGGMFSTWFSAGTQSGDTVTDISGIDPGVTATDNLAVLHLHADSAGTFTLDLSGAAAATATRTLAPTVNDGTVTINVCDSNNCPSDVEFIGTATTDEIAALVCYGKYHCRVVADEIISDPDNSIQVGSEYTIGYGNDQKYIKSGDKIKVDGSYYHSCGAFGQWDNICGDVDKVGLPDLIIQDISWSPSSPEQGDTVTFTATIKNQGTGDATAFYIYYYVDGSYHAMDTVYSLSAGSTTTETFTWTASKCGNVQVKAVADANNAVSESNEGNNERTETVNVECPDPEPDYIVQDISWSPISPEQGETITFTVTIKNQGDWDDSSFCVYYYIDGSYQDMDTVYGMNTGSTITETFTWTANKCGNVQVKAVADANNVIPESNEGNNERTETVNVECPDPDLIIQDITWSPSSPEQGDAIAFTVTIKNQGAGSAGSSTAKYYIDGSYVTYDSVPALSAGSTSTQTFTWAADRCGNVQVKAVADANNAVSESNEGNNERTETVNVECPDPDLITQDVSWSPSSPEQGDTMTFTVTIKNQGLGSAGSSTAKYYIDGSYVTYDSVPALSAGSTSTQTFTWTANKCGNVQVKAVADANNAVSESNEGNNERTETMNVDCLEEIKFNGTAIEYFSLIGAWGWYVSVDEIISGPSELQDHTVKVYLASVNPDQYPPGYMDPTIEPGDKVGVYGWYQGYDIVALFGSEDYYIKKISPTPKPDLVIDPITYSPSNPQKDEIVTFTVKIKNQGAGSAGSSMVKYYIDGSYVTYDSVPALSAGSTSTQTFTWTADKCGNVLVKAVADANNAVSESDEGNNERTETVSISCQTDLPDLIIQNITWSPSSPEQGDTVIFTVNIKNQGTEDATSFYVFYYVDGSSYTYDGISGLPAGSISTQTFAWIANKCGTIQVKGVADATNAVPEGNEGNNERTETVSISCKPDLIIRDISWNPSSPKQGDAITFTVKIKNQGSVSTETSSTVNYYIDNSPVNSDSVPALVAGETSTQTFIWTANKCGNIQVKAVADANNAVSEGDEGNNERIETVSINCPSGSLTVTIYPAEVRSQARWKLTSGPDTNWHSSGDTVSNIPVDSYTIQFNDVSGWTKPSDIPITINEGSNSESGTYTQNPGSLTVTIYPSGVRTDARWKLTAGPDTNWHSSGDTVSNIPVDSYTIQFNDVSGWTKPSDIPITINEGSNSEYETYTSEGEVDAEFYAISSWPEGVYKPCRVIQPTVWVKNTGDVTHEFFVSMYIENWDNPKKNYTTYGSIIVDPDRFKGVELSWEVPSDAIGGFYRVVFVLWKTRVTRVTSDEFEGEGELDGEVYDPFRIANADYEHFATIAEDRAIIVDALIVRYSTQEEKDIEEEWNKELRYMVSEGWDEAQKGLSVDPKSGHPFIDGVIELCGLFRLGHEAQKGTDTYTKMVDIIDGRADNIITIVENGDLIKKLKSKTTFEDYKGEERETGSVLDLMGEYSKHCRKEAEYWRDYNNKKQLLKTRLEMEAATLGQICGALGYIGRDKQGDHDLLMEYFGGNLGGSKDELTYLYTLYNNLGYDTEDLLDEYRHTLKCVTGIAECPVYLHAYDSEGNHVGVNSSGGVDLDIPNAYYSGPSSDPQIIQIFGINDYYFVIEALDQGEFNLTTESRTYEETTAVQYERVAIENKTNAIINHSKEGYAIDIDEDGDGITDYAIDPTSVETNHPPEVSIVAIPDDMIFKGDMSISYTLKDIDNDICNISARYSTDQMIWHDATMGSGGDGTIELSSSADGVTHTYVWASSIDLPDISSAVYFEIKPNDGVTDGIHGISNAFYVGEVTAAFTYSPSNPTVSKHVIFATYASIGNITNYTWNFGDGNTMNTAEPIIIHSYTSEDTYTVNLTVTDNEGSTNTTSRDVIVWGIYGCGDLNHDNHITPADAAITLQLAASGGWDPAADVNHDNHITSLDALMILQAAADEITL